MKSKFEIGDVVEFIDKESNGKFPHTGSYKIISTGKMKSPKTGEWTDAYVYAEEEARWRLFIRDQKDMDEKFQKKIKKIETCCPFCGRPMIWSSDFNADELGFDDPDGIVTFYTCPECGTVGQFTQTKEGLEAVMPEGEGIEVAWINIYQSPNGMRKYFTQCYETREEANAHINDYNFGFLGQKELFWRKK